MRVMYACHDTYCLSTGDLISPTTHEKSTGHRRPSHTPVHPPGTSQVIPLLGNFYLGGPGLSHLSPQTWHLAPGYLLSRYSGCPQGPEVAPPGCPFCGRPSLAASHKTTTRNLGRGRGTRSSCSLALWPQPWPWPPGPALWLTISASSFPSPFLFLSSLVHTHTLLIPGSCLQPNRKDRVVLEPKVDLVLYICTLHPLSSQG